MTAFDDAVEAMRGASRAQWSGFAKGVEDLNAVKLRAALPVIAQALKDQPHSEHERRIIMRCADFLGGLEER